MNDRERLEVLEAKVLTIQEGLKRILDELTMIEERVKLHEVAEKPVEVKAEAKPVEARAEAKPAETQQPTVPQSQAPQQPPARGPPDLKAVLPKTSDNRPIGWLMSQLEAEKRNGNLDYEVLEDDRHAAVTVWFAKTVSVNDRQKVQRWTTWARKTLEGRK
jgi:hypothetical protein